MPSCFALYRLPYRQECHYISGVGETFASLRGLDGRSGFVIAPFIAGAGTPIVLIRPEKINTFPGCEAVTEDIRNIISRAESRNLEADDGGDEREAYGEDFRRCHAMLDSGEFSKIVLARRHNAPRIALTAFELFSRACSLYPRVMVALFCSPWSGLWLVASPEILLEQQGGEWRTIALAGTMETQGGWSEKNIREQRYVATYISDCLRPFAANLREDGPRTVRAGHLMHLRSDFTFNTDPGNVSCILEALHPTPAVCGLPKLQTLLFIADNEHQPRGYYTGFFGPLATASETHLFVTLRCMEIGSRAVSLYAGGGLLKDSAEDSEWTETESKMKTMRRLLSPE